MKPPVRAARAFSPPKGSVLIVSLWVVVFFGIVSVFVSARTSSQVHVIKRFKDQTALRLAASSGVSYALDVIRKRQSKIADVQAPDVDDYYWFKDPKIFKEIRIPGRARLFFLVGRRQAEGTEAVGEGSQASPEGFVAGMEDEGSRININKASEAVFAKIYAGAGGEAALDSSKAQALARATIQWRERKEPFLEFGHALQGDRSGFGGVEELLAVPGMTLPLWSALKDRLTVYGKGLNLNTVSKETLLLLGIGDSLAGRIVSTREGGDTATAEGDRAAGAKERPYSDLGDLEQRIGVSSEEDATLQEFSSFWIFDVDTFRFLSVTWVSPDGFSEEAEPANQRPASAAELGRTRPARTGVECVATLDGQLLVYREISFAAEFSQVSH